MELIAEKPVEKFIKKGINIYHLRYEVEDIVLQLKRLKANGGMQISDIKNAVLFNNRAVVFILTQLGIIELLEGGK